MNAFRLISSKQTIAELFSDFNIGNTDWVGKAQRHIGRALDLMHIDGYYERAYALENVEEFKAPLPCDEKYLLATVLPEYNFCRLPVTRRLSLGINFKDIRLHSHYKGTINYNYLHTNFETGKVMYVYYRSPLDEEGNLMIPDNPDVLEALPFYIIYKLSFSGYKHPVISIEDAYAKWMELYPRARNSMNYPSVEEKHRSTMVYTNPIFTNLIDEDWSLISGEGWATVDFIEELNILRNGTDTGVDEWEETI